MSLRGSLRTMPVEDLFDWVDRRFVCGSLTLERGDVVRTFQFDSGYVTAASANVPAEFLGQMLMDRELISEEQLSEAFKVQADTGVLLGKILLMIGAVNEAQLRQVLEEKIQAALFDALGWTEGALQFDRAPERTTVSAFEVSVNLRSAIEDGLQRVAAWRELRELIPTDDISFYVLNIADGVRTSDDPKLAAKLRRLLDEVATGTTVNEVVLRHNGNRFDVVSGLAILLERGAVASDRRSEARAPMPRAATGGLEREARGRAARGDRSGAFEMARGALTRDPENPAVKKLYRELERSVFAELSRDLLATFTVPKLLKSKDELAALDMSDTERYLASRVDGHWDILSLMRISPLREVESLMTFKRLADRGIIEL